MFEFCHKQIRMKIIEGRQLAGANIHPVVRVSVGKESKQTRVKSATNRPHYDEVCHLLFRSSFGLIRIA